VALICEVIHDCDCGHISAGENGEQRGQKQKQNKNITENKQAHQKKLKEKNTQPPNTSKNQQTSDTNVQKPAKERRRKKYNKRRLHFKYRKTGEWGQARQEELIRECKLVLEEGLRVLGYDGRTEHGQHLPQVVGKEQEFSEVTQLSIDRRDYYPTKGRRRRLHLSG